MPDVIKELLEQLDALPESKTVVMPAGPSSGDDIIEAIRLWEKRNGKSWRQ